MSDTKDDPLRNPKDPLHRTGPEAERELFRLFGRAADGFSHDVVIGAAANVLINSLRQAHPSRLAAEAKFDELTGRLKAILMDHYDGLGRRRNVFPFHQNIDVPLFDARRLKH